MKTYKIELEVDAEWLEVIQNVTNVDYLEEGEVLVWNKVEEL